MELDLISIEEASKIPPDICEKLFPRRMERARKYRRREDSLRCVGAGALLERAGIGEADILYNEYGKPFVKREGLFFSLSHSGDYAVLAVDSVPVGVDIEKHARYSSGVAERVFTNAELEWMRTDPYRRFYALWTMKESAVKLDGRGLQLELRSFSVLPLIEGRPVLSENGLIYGRGMQLDGYSLSVCSAREIGDINLRSIQW